jgi:heat shock protein HtpX
MARLSDLKIAMGTSILIAAFIFGIFIFAILYFLQLDLVTGLVVGLGAVALFILFQYAVGPSIVAATARLHYLKPGENPWLETTIKDLSQKSGLPMPRVATVPNNTPNAFTFGRSQSSATIAVHDGLLNSLNEDEVRGVIAHELGHIKHKDYIVMTVLSALPLVAYIVAQTALRAGMYSGYSRGRRENNPAAAFIAIGVISFIVYIVTFLSVMRLSRLREHYADAYSAYVTGIPRSLESGLAKITYGLSISPKPPEGARAFYIEDPALAKQEVQTIMQKKEDYDLDHDGVLDERELELAMERESKSTWNQLNTLFATHPPTFKRILLLREIENEMSTGKYTQQNIYAHI